MRESRFGYTYRCMYTSGFNFMAVVVERQLPWENFRVVFRFNLGGLGVEKSEMGGTLKYCVHATLTTLLHLGKS